MLVVVADIEALVGKQWGIAIEAFVVVQIVVAVVKVVAVIAIAMARVRVSAIAIAIAIPSMGRATKELVRRHPNRMSPNRRRLLPPRVRRERRPPMVRSGPETVTKRTTDAKTV